MSMATAAALAGLGRVAAPFVIVLVKKSISYLGNDMAKGLEDLETTLMPQFERTIQAAQNNPPDDIASLDKWLTRLKNAYYEAEGILHELEYKRLKRKARGEDKKLLVRISSKPIIKPLVKFIDRVVKKASLLSSQKRKLLQRLNELKKVAAEAKDFRELLGIQNTQSTQNTGNNRSVTSSLLTDKVFGRDGYRDNIINFMLNEQGSSSSINRYSVVAVTGMGGVGKTTLAQYVYDDERVKKHFDVRMWLCLSQSFDINKLTKEMIVYASGKKCPNLPNLDALQNNLIETLHESNNIMVVLDDVWYDNNDKVEGEKQWENLLKPFNKIVLQGGTCKIMVTSRSSRPFPNALQPRKPIIELQDLAPRDFMSLLRYRTIDDLQISNPQLENDFSIIVDQIAEKMSKLPLAAKVVGNQLRQQPDIKFWQATLENVNLSDILEIFLWSFHQFDVQLQRCFLFCGIFPKGQRHHDDLIDYWVALDFIQPSDDNINVEKIGLEYIEIMVANSIFRVVNETRKVYIMHDLFHDLAEKLCVGDCFRVTNTEREIPSTVQHVYLQVNNENLKEKLSSICNLSNLRTLILGNQFIDDISEIISKISTNFRNLRVLDVWSGGYSIVPRHVGDLKNLWLLCFWKSSIKELPDSMLQLYHLQFLILPSSVKTLPTKLSNLIKLRRIDMYDSDANMVNTLPQVPYLSKLTSLQRLDEFHVRKEKGYELHQLGTLKEIGGPLRIVNLQNVRDKDEAVKARLIDKPKLERLELVWDEAVELNGLEIEIIEALRPPANLEYLTIDGYGGSTYPTWLQEGSYIKCIKEVTFCNCNALTNLPQNFNQFRQCSVLVLQNLGALREFSTFPEKLARLTIIDCPSLIFVCENELQVNANTCMRIMNQVFCCVSCCKDILDHELKSFKQTASLENRAKLLPIVESVAQSDEAESPVPSNLTRAWWSCHQQRLNFIFISSGANKLKLPSMLRILNLSYCCVSNVALSECLRGMVILEEIHLFSIMTITTLPPAEVMESLKGLRVLNIKHCWCLTSLGGLHALPHLEHFLVEGCWCSEIGSGDTLMLPSTLQSIKIIKCGVSQAILNNNFPCVRNVVIWHCYVPNSLSFHQLTNLKTLWLGKCPRLSSIQGLESCTTLECIHFNVCPSMLRLPNLPSSVQHIEISGCPKLRESCRPDGLDWHNIEHIELRDREIDLASMPLWQ